MNNRIVPEFIRIKDTEWINIDKITSVYCDNMRYDVLILTINLSDGRSISFSDFDDIKRVRDLLHTAIPSLYIPITFSDEPSNGGGK